LEALLTSIFLVAVSEIGDKTQLLAFVLAARLRKPWPVIGGILLATLVNHSLAGWIGTLLAGWIAPATLAWIVGLSFIGFGLWALHPDSLDDSPRLHKAGAFVTAFIAFFLAEMGDKTQFATIALAARFNSLFLVVLGTTIGMMLADVPAVWLGEKLALKIPMKTVRVVAAALFIVVGALTLWGAYGGAN
jgi:putative Ca2+/H+ antiporter (TMEM165/GDT1 family)